MKKKILCFALISIAAISAAAFAGCDFGGGGGGGGSESVTQDNMRFERKDDGTYELVRYEYAYIEDADGNRYTGTGETVTVPETVNGKAVTSIAKYAFGNTGVKSVTFPSAISVLPDRVFDGCELLETVTMSKVTSVGEMAFYDCASLESIAFASGLTEIGARAFEKCPALTTVTLPDTVKTLGEGCFRECPFESINTAGVEILDGSAFYNCENLTALSLPNVKSIGGSAMRDCEKLAELTIGNKLKEYAEALYGCTSLTKVSISSPVPEKMFQWNKTICEVTLGEGVTSVGEMAFGYCSKITAITLPATLTEIGKSAFWESGVTEISIPASVKTVGDKAFYGCRKLERLTIAEGVASIGAEAFAETAITSLSLPASVKTVGNSAFCDCNSLVSLEFHEGLESIGAKAFAIKGGEALEIVLPSTVKAIGDNCFSYQWGNEKGTTAKKIIINETVETVGKNILDGCKVKELAAPASYGQHGSNATLEKLTLFGEGIVPNNAYSNCANLKTVTLGTGIKSIDSNAFKSLETIHLGGVEYMGTGALGDLSTLAYTKIENGVKYIDGWAITSDYSNGGATILDVSGLTGIYPSAFEKTNDNDTSVLKTVVFVGSDDTSNLKCIGRNAFRGSGITAAEVPSSIQNWDFAFADCKELRTVQISRGVSTIPSFAFSGCSNLTDLTFVSNDVKKINSNAFYGCTSLGLVDLKGVEEIGKEAFDSCTGLYKVVMNNVKKIGSSAFYRCTRLTEFNFTTSVTEIDFNALYYAETINYDGTKEQWEAVVKGTDIWHSDNDLTVNFADGTSEIYTKQ